MDIDNFDFQELKTRVSRSDTGKWSQSIFQEIKSALINSLLDIITQNKRYNRGPKPKPVIISKILDAIFENLDSGTKINYLETHYGIKRATYYRYLNLIIVHNLFQRFHQQLLQGYKKPSLLIVDGSHIRSINGSEGVNYGYKENSKRALKITILTGTNKVIYLHGSHPDNLNDHIAFAEMVTKNTLNESVDVLADSGYNGREFKATCKQAGYNVISCVKRWRNGPSHILSNYQQMILKKNRYKVEHVLSQLKNLRGLQLKSNRLVKFYNMFFNLGCLLVSIHNGIIKNGLKSPIRLLLRAKN